MRHNNRGFSLAELMTVIAIIGILASVVIVSLSGARERARDSKRISDLQQVQLALEFYYDANGNSYPPALGDLTPIFIDSIPADPQPPATYSYESDGTNYVLGAPSFESSSNLPDDDIDNGERPSGLTAVDCSDPAYCVKP